jgi:iron complex outermembrane receptor protein
MSNDCRKLWRGGAVIVLLGLGTGGTPLRAQRTGDNATTSATDAFGRRIGDEDIGIYDTGNVRGFSPIDAGNVRIEGLFFDQQPGLNGRLVEGSRVHVGVSAQGYPFPAPTGISDFSLRRPGARPLVSTLLRYGPFGHAATLEVDAQLPLDGERLGLAFGAAAQNGAENYGGTPQSYQIGAIGAFHPTPRTELLAFWSRQRTFSDEAQPVAFTVGGLPPARVPRGIFAGQRWARFDGTGHNFGLIGKTALGRVDLSAGLFRSLGAVARDFSDLLIGVDPSGRAAERLIIADRDNRFSAVSGELRGALDIADGPRRHEIFATVRGRSEARIYGGSDVVRLGPSRFGVPDFRPEPALTFGPKARDSVRQLTAGIGYSLGWRNLGQLQIGLLKTSYEKRVTDLMGALLDPQSRDSLWLFNAAGAVNLLSRVTLYASYSRGLEESPSAPSSAVNRDEAPPAIRSRQIDAGLRWAIGPALTAVAGLFEIEKPYFFLDAAGIFRRLGTLRNRGVELSLAGTLAPGLTIVAGSVFLDPHVSGEAVDRGLIGARPVGSLARNSIFSVDYRFPAAPSLSLDARVESTRPRYGPGAVIPPRAVLSLGGRYRFALNGVQLLLRGQIGNVLNKYGVIPLTNGGYVYNAQRRISLSIAADL